jgi:hypothetical protein
MYDYCIRADAPRLFVTTPTQLSTESCEPEVYIFVTVGRATHRPRLHRGRLEWIAGRWMGGQTDPSNREIGKDPTEARLQLVWPEPP